MIDQIDWKAIIEKGLKWAKEFQLLPKVIEALAAKRHRILILGPSGVGKTQFVRSVLDPLASAVPTNQRTPGVQRRKANVERTPFLLIDTPGQGHDEAKRAVAIRKAVQGQIDGIISVTCFGYHERDEADARVAVPQKGSRVANAPFLTANRAQELNRLAEWVPSVDSKACPWVLTVITKADLWWPMRTRVMNYYRTGKYASRLKHLYVVPYCSTIRPFLGGRTSAQFGDKDREALRGVLLESLRHLAGDQV